MTVKMKEPEERFICPEELQMQTLSRWTMLDAEAFQELLNLAGDDSGFLEDLLATYAEQADQLLLQAKQEAREGRHEGVMRAMHALNGSSRNVAATSVAVRCAAIEAEAHDRIAPAVLTRSLEALDLPLAAALVELRHRVEEQRVGMEQ